MKTTIQKPWLLPVIMAGLSFMSAGRMTAQTFTALHEFTALSAPSFDDGTNKDGAYPNSGLILSGNTLYGAAEDGGSKGDGAIFAVETDGMGFTNLYSFTNGVDGETPEAGLVLSGGILYGTTEEGGSSGVGTVFAIGTNGAGFTNLYTFTNGNDGGFPQASLILSGNTLYGTALIGGGGSGYGTVFAVAANGAAFTNLHSFTGGTNGGLPDAGLILSGGTLYGTAFGEEFYPTSILFSVATNGMNFTNLYSFSQLSAPWNDQGTNSDGANVVAGLMLSGNTLYGAAKAGGASGYGTLFAIATNGMNFTTLYDFTNGSDGAYPVSNLILSNGRLYGTATDGGNPGYGTLFSITTAGTNFTTLYSFTNGADGAEPYTGSLILSDSTLYGAAEGGGSAGDGTVFSLSLQPQLTITLSGTNVILDWTNSAPGFTLQSTPALAPPVWSAVSATQGNVNGEYNVTNPISGTQQFYRLSQ
jgi:uncharacterized repeat protein (TIGR03803 family)